MRAFQQDYAQVRALAHVDSGGKEMSKPYLEVTYLQGKPFAACLYLDRRSGDKSVRSERHGTWLVDFTSDGRAIGIEFTWVGAVNPSEINRVLTAGHQPAVSPADLTPLEVP